MNPSFARSFADGSDLSRWTEDGRFQSPAPGCLLVKAAEPHCRLLLSCGVHGDETAPIEMVDRLIGLIRDATLVPAAEILFVIGNPAAIRAGKRYVEHDMNRLFDGAWEQKTELEEARRAKVLEEVARAFASEASPAWHLDLHTTIRASRIERFAIANAASAKALPKGLRELLHSASLGALVLSPRSRGTFSAFTSRLPGMASLTLELGQGHRFGENAPGATRDLEEALRCLMRGETLPLPSKEEPVYFEVTREIIREADDFAFHLPNEMENFTELEAGQPVAGEMRAEKGERVLFPNPKVAVGLRAGLLVRRISC